MIVIYSEITSNIELSHLVNTGTLLIAIKNYDSKYKRSYSDFVYRALEKVLLNQTKLCYVQYQTPLLSLTKWSSILNFPNS
jgi:hypothetical protein